jgi:hypothetical protein
MNEVFRKLNYRGQETIYVSGAPASFGPALAQIGEVAEVKSALGKAKGVEFAMAFATKQSELDTFADAVAKAAGEDAVVWVAYPKGTSKKYECEFNRDSGWDRFAAHGYEPVRMVAIDEDWSALRLRRVEKIKPRAGKKS